MPLAALVVLALVLGLSGCTARSPASVESRNVRDPVPHGYYRVRQGDTLSEIAQRQRLAMSDLARWNGLSPPYQIESGSLLRLVADPAAGSKTSPSPSEQTEPERVAGRSPGPAKTATNAAPANKRGEPTPAAASKGATAKLGAGGLSWQWPLTGRVVQGFREGDRTRQGIRIAGRAGQEVVAAEGGRVVYSGSGLKGYGNLIIVRHNNEFLSAYGFNRRLLVKEGQQVRRGQGVAEVGQTAGGEHLLHFEIRRNGLATDPLAYLPRSR